MRTIDYHGTSPRYNLQVIVASRKMYLRTKRYSSIPRRLVINILHPYATQFFVDLDRFDIFLASRSLVMSTSNMAASWRQANDVIAPG